MDKMPNNSTVSTLEIPLGLVLFTFSCEVDQPVTLGTRIHKPSHRGGAEHRRLQRHITRKKSICIEWCKRLLARMNSGSNEIAAFRIRRFSSSSCSDEYDTSQSNSSMGPYDGMHDAESQLRSVSWESSDDTFQAEPQSVEETAVYTPSTDLPYVIPHRSNTKAAKKKDDIVEQRRAISRRQCWGMGLALSWVCVVLVIVIRVSSVQLMGDDHSGRARAARESVVEKNVSGVMSSENTTGLGAALCNGLANLCYVRANEVLFATLPNNYVSSNTHVRSLGTSESGNMVSVEDALATGYRGLYLDLGKCNGELRLVQGLCSAGSRAAFEALVGIVQFLTANPSEVIVLPMQIQDSAGGGRVHLDEIVQLFDAIPGWTDLMHAHPGPDYPWPVLQDLIDKKKRILFFFYNAIEMCTSSGTACPPGFHDWSQYAIEAKVSDFERSPKSCGVSSGANNTGDFFVANFSPQHCDAQNGGDFVAAQLEVCSILHGGSPSLLMIDCWNSGGVLERVFKHNAAIVPLAHIHADVNISLVGIAGAMRNQTVDHFERICNRFFSDQLQPDLANIECRIDSFKEVLEAKPALHVLVQVSADKSAHRRSLFNATTLVGIIESNGEMLRMQLASGSNYFGAVSDIHTVAATKPIATKKPISIHTLSPVQVSRPVVATKVPISAQTISPDPLPQTVFATKKPITLHTFSPSSISQATPATKKPISTRSAP